MESLFTLRPAREDDLPTINAFAAVEGMADLPSIDRVTVAESEAGDVVGFVRIAAEEEGVGHVNPIVVYSTWRGYGVGRALMDDALARYGELRLVSRGSSLGFYRALGFHEVPWDRPRHSGRLQRMRHPRRMRSHSGGAHTGLTPRRWERSHGRKANRAPASAWHRA